MSLVLDGTLGVDVIKDGSVREADLHADVARIGVGQTWQNVTASRVAGTTYTNTTGKPITLTVQLQDTSDHAIEVGGVDVCRTDLSGVSGSFISLIAIVPNGFTYRLRASAFSYWSELR